MKDLTVLDTAADVALQPIVISSERLLAGSPAAKYQMVAKSRDKTNWVVVWECTPGTFNTYFPHEETCVIVSGEVFVTPAGGTERRLGPGDFGFFPARSCSKWRVTETVRKVAVRRIEIPLPLSLGTRAWHKLLCIAGLRSAPIWGREGADQIRAAS